MKKAQYFITCSELPVRTVNEMTPQRVRNLLVQKPRKKYDDRQLILDFGDEEMTLFIFDNTFEGLLTSVFEAYSRRTFRMLCWRKGSRFLCSMTRLLL